jgi:hypothetical protein
MKMRNSERLLYETKMAIGSFKINNKGKNVLDYNVERVKDMFIFTHKKTNEVEYKYRIEYVVVEEESGLRRLWRNLFCKHKNTKTMLGINERKVICAECGKVVYSVEV